MAFLGPLLYALNPKNIVKGVGNFIGDTVSEIAHGGNVLKTVADNFSKGIKTVIGSDDKSVPYSPGANGVAQAAYFDYLNNNISNKQSVIVPDTTMNSYTKQTINDHNPVNHDGSGLPDMSKMYVNDGVLGTEPAPQVYQRPPGMGGGLYGRKQIIVNKAGFPDVKEIDFKIKKAHKKVKTSKAKKARE